MISAGEASGDVHAGALARELKKIDPTVEIFGMGGEHLREAGGEVLFDIKDHGVMGVVEVISNLPKLFEIGIILFTLFSYSLNKSSFSSFISL